MYNQYCSLQETPQGLKGGEAISLLYNYIYHINIIIYYIDDLYILYKVLLLFIVIYLYIKYYYLLKINRS